MPTVIAWVRKLSRPSAEIGELRPQPVQQRGERIELARRAPRQPEDAWVGIGALRHRARPEEVEVRAVHDDAAGGNCREDRRRLEVRPHLVHRHSGQHCPGLRRGVQPEEAAGRGERLPAAETQEPDGDDEQRDREHGETLEADQRTGEDRRREARLQQRREPAGDRPRGGDRARQKEREERREEGEQTLDPPPAVGERALETEPTRRLPPTAPSSQNFAGNRRSRPRADSRSLRRAD